ncbi:MAG: phage holin family protein [candidate division WOR-3 bacterium]
MINKDDILTFLISTATLVMTYLFSLTTDQKMVLIMFLILIYLDVISGVWKAIVKKKITSEKYLAGLAFKIVLLLCILFLGIFTERVLQIKTFPFVALLACVGEIISIRENVMEASGKDILHHFLHAATLLKRISKTIKDDASTRKDNE